MDKRDREAVFDYWLDFYGSIVSIYSLLYLVLLLLLWATYIEKKMRKWVRF